MNFDELKHSLDTLAFDHRLEVILAELMENQQLEQERMEVRPVGIFHRGSSRDMVHVEAYRDKLERIERIIFQTSREGIYDGLPSGVFHAPRTRKFQKSADEIAKEVQLQQEEEAAARDFFQPLEQEFFRFRLKMEQQERQVFSGFSRKEGQEVFLRDFWGIDVPDLGSDQITALLYVLPLSYTYKGDLEKVEMIMSAVLRTPVQLTPSWGNEERMEDSMLPALGDSYLGVDLIIGGQVAFGLPGLKMAIGPIAGSQLIDYLEGGRHVRLIELLSEFFLPVEVPVQTEVKVREEDSILHLGGEPHHARLGFTTQLAK